MQSSPISPADVRFHNPSLSNLGIEVMRLSTLRERVSARHLAKPQRVAFFMLLFIEEGFLRHIVDFSELRLGAGSLVFVRPGQVQHWHLDGRAQGCMVLLDPVALAPNGTPFSPVSNLLVSMEEWPVGVRLDDEFAREMRFSLTRLARDQEDFDGGPHDVALIRQEMLAVLLRLERWHRRRALASSTSRRYDPQVYRLFRAELEKGYRTHHAVGDYARRLGYSESTLNRVCRRAAGKSAKVLIDQRLAMEAARLMVHSNASVVEVSHQLGFSEPTNFSRFFVRMVGATPSKFRSMQGGRAP